MDSLLTDALAVAQHAARVGGQVLESWAERFTVSEKSRANLVTEADVESQQAIHEIIRARFPEHDFLGEEQNPAGDDPPALDRASSCRWIVDPLDGTTNYVHRFPFYAVSIALEIDGQLAVGVVFDPNRNEMFTAVRGQGAMLNGKPLHPTATGELNRALVVASLPVAVGTQDPAVARFLRVLPVAQSLQRTGSAALNLAYVASGRVDAFWSTSLKPWDMAAGVLLVREAGGRVSQIDGGTFDLYRPDVLSSNGTAIHEELRKLLP